MSDEHERTVSFQWNYIDLLSPDPVEFNPQLHFFLSQGVDNVRPVVNRIEIRKSDNHFSAIQRRNKQHLLYKINNRIIEPRRKDQLFVDEEQRRSQSRSMGIDLGDQYGEHENPKRASALHCKLACAKPREMHHHVGRAHHHHHHHHHNKHQHNVPTLNIGETIEEFAARTIYAPWYAKENLTACTFVYGSGGGETSGNQPQLLDQDTTLNVDAFAHTYNNKGELCLAEAGTCSLYLKDVFDKLAAEPGKDLVVQKTLKIYNANGLVKGMIVFVFSAGFIRPTLATDRFAIASECGQQHVQSVANVDSENNQSIDAYLSSIKFDSTAATDSKWSHQPSSKLIELDSDDDDDDDNAQNEQSVKDDDSDELFSFQAAHEANNDGERQLEEHEVFHPPSMLDYRADNKRTYTSYFKRYILANYVVFAERNSRPSWPFMRNIHSPMYRFRGITVPGLCFTLLCSKHARNTERYYLNLLYIALRRHYKYMDAHRAMTYFTEEADDREVALILAEMSCIFSNYCNYMTDKAHTLKRENERYVAAAEKVAFVEHQMFDEKQEKQQQGEEVHDLHEHVQQTSLPTAELAENESAETIQPCDTSPTNAVCELDDDDNDVSAEKSSKTDDAFVSSTSVQRESDTDDGEDDDADESYDEEYYRIKQMTLANKQRARAAYRHMMHCMKQIKANYAAASRVSAKRARQINDPAHIQLIESFSVWLRYTKTGDCEDMAREILRPLWDLRSGEFEHPALQKLQRVRREYSSLQTLKGVTSAAIEDDLNQVEDMGAHMDITLLYTPYLLSLMQQFNSHEPLLDELSEAYKFPVRERALPTLICEGTGCLKPDGSANEALAAKLYLMRGSGDTFLNVKTMLHQPLKKSSSFYKTIQSALVHDFIADGYGIGEVVFFRRNRSSKETMAQRYERYAANPQQAKHEQWDENDFHRLMHDQVAENAQKHATDNDQLSQVPSLENMSKSNGAYDEQNRAHMVANTLEESGTSIVEHRSDELLQLAYTIREHHANSAYGKAFRGDTRVSTEQLLAQAKQERIGAGFEPGYLEEFGRSARRAQVQRMGVASAATYGIEHTHLMNFNVGDVMLYTMPDLHLEELQRFARVLQQNYPVESMDVCTQYTAEQWEHSYSQKHANLLLEQVRASVRSRNNSARVQTLVQQRRVVYVDFYYKYDQVNRQRMSKLRTLLRSKPHIVDVQYFEEPLTNNADGSKFGGYLVRFVCKRLKVVRR